MISSPLRYPIRSPIRSAIGAAFDGPALDLNFLSGALDPRLTFTRASAGTRVNSAGVLVSEPANTPRFDYDPVTLAALGLMIEPQRTNLLLQSVNPIGAGWTWPAGATISADEVTVTLDTNLVTHFQSVAVTPGVVYTGSVEVKLGTLPASEYKIAVYNETGGSMIAVDIIPAQVVSTAAWTRIWYTFTAPAGCTSLRWYVLRNGNATNNGKTVLLRRPQFEAGASATSYIPTTTAQATRFADTLDLPSTYSAAILGGSPLTVVAEYAILGLTGTNQFVFDVTDGTVNNCASLFFENNNTWALRNVSGTPGQPGIATPHTIGALIKSALSLSTSGFLGACKGQSMSPAQGALALPTLNQIRIGSRVANYFNAQIVMRRFTVYRRASTQAQLNAMTT